MGNIPPDDGNSSGRGEGAGPCGTDGAELARGAVRLLPEVYDELRRLAHARMAELSAGQTLQPTALVHEAYLRLSAKSDERWNDTRVFFLAAARAMHDILVERARHKSSLKRGGERRRLELDALAVAADAPSQEMLALTDALGELERHDARKHQVVMLRFFAGCTAEQTAQAVNVSTSTVERDWRFARAWLHQRLSDGSGAEGSGDAG